ncbi:MAG: DUF1667 domain-containing protein [Clostridia bacterium]|nr:DUF1667 domain-containing protein [Clostridia bacterium]
MKKEYTCIMCPMGCSLTVTEGKSGIAVSGNSCRRGAEYAIQEYKDPKRIVTALAFTDVVNCVVPVKTDALIPKGKITDVLAVVSQLKISLPISLGQVVVSNVCDLGANIIVTRTLGAIGKR